MQCFESIEIHPQTPADMAQLARVEAHAQGCVGCGSRLAELRELDGLLSEGLLGLSTSTICPDPETLAVWIESGRPRDEDLEAHLAGCDVCRADFLDAVEVEEPVVAVTRSRTSGVWIAAAAAVLVGVGLTALLVSSSSSTEDTPVVTKSPAPKVERKKSDTQRIPRDPALDREKTNTPEVDPTPRARPTPKEDPDPTPDASRRPTPPRPDPVVPPAPEPEPQPTPPSIARKPDPEPEPKPEPKPNEPTPPVTPPKGPTAVAMRVDSSLGLSIRRPGERKWEAFSKGDLAPQSELRASRRGARINTPNGLVLLAPKSRAGWQETLTLESGQAILEGRGLRLSVVDGTVEVRGRVLVEARRKQFGVRVLAGRAKVVRPDREPIELGWGASLVATRGKAARHTPGQVKPGKPGPLPAWARPLHPNPNRPVRPPRRRNRPKPPRSPRQGARQPRSQTNGRTSGR